MWDEYSPTEKKLIEAFDLKDYASAPGRVPALVYREMVLMAVVKDMTGPHVEAAKRAYQHLAKGKYRGTVEFDDLISFEGPEEGPLHRPC